ncbi:MAG: hypothetical protein O2897_05420, partial [bacterium]|nr:hypothetical protein [bacterium]
NFRVPSLAEVFEAFPGVFINIDIKDHSKKAVTLVVDLVRKYRALDRVRLASFSFRVHEFLRDLKFEGLVSLSRAEIIKTIFMPESFLKEQYLGGKSIQIPVSWGPFPLDSENFIAKCHRLGLKVEYWTINSRQVAKKLQQRGADGIMSDDPASVNINLV